MTTPSTQTVIDDLPVPPTVPSTPCLKTVKNSIEKTDDIKFPIELAPFFISKKNEEKTIKLEVEFNNDDNNNQKKGKIGLIDHNTKNENINVEVIKDKSTPAPNEQQFFLCPFETCAKTFYRKHNLKSHLAIHTQEKKYLCNDCGLRFLRKYDRKRHAINIHKVTNVECDLCFQTFDSDRIFRDHYIA
ncbi:hypothetical protein HK099_002215, partial [Clydaea vesicula]